MSGVRKSSPSIRCVALVAALWAVGWAGLGCQPQPPSGSAPETRLIHRLAAPPLPAGEGSEAAQGSAPAPASTAATADTHAALPAEGSAQAPATSPPDGTGVEAGTGAATAEPATGPPATWQPPDQITLDPEAAVLDPDLSAFVATTPDGFRVVLTLDPDLQGYLTDVTSRYDEPAEAVVVIEPASGRVLAWVEHHNADPPTPHPLLAADAFAASVFKIVTASALVEEANLGFDRRMCVPPGAASVEEADLVADPARDTRCVDFVEAMSQSVNTYFARLAIDELTPEVMSSWLDRFGFNTPIPFETAVAPSQAVVPEERLERARMAAGFRHVHMSPLHGALIAAAVANHGVMMVPTLVDRVLDASGNVVYTREPRVWRQVMSPQTAETMTHALGETTITGTASRYFAQREGWPADLHVAGKTGTLSNRTDENTDPQPLLIYSWFVGFAPMDAPRMAVASLVYNGERWYIKGAYLASEAVIRLLRGPGR